MFQNQGQKTEVTVFSHTSTKTGKKKIKRKRNKFKIALKHITFKSQFNKNCL